MCWWVRGNSDPAWCILGQRFTRQASMNSKYKHDIVGLCRVVGMVESVQGHSTIRSTMGAAILNLTGGFVDRLQSVISHTWTLFGAYVVAPDDLWLSFSFLIKRLCRETAVYTKNFDIFYESKNFQSYHFRACAPSRNRFNLTMLTCLATLAIVFYLLVRLHFSAEELLLYPRRRRPRPRPHTKC